MASLPSVIDDAPPGKQSFSPNVQIFHPCLADATDGWTDGQTDDRSFLKRYGNTSEKYGRDTIMVAR